MNEEIVNGWTIKWEGNKEAFTKKNRFILIDEVNDVIANIWFEDDKSDVFTFEKQTFYNGAIRVDPLHTTITIADDEDEYLEEEYDEE